jgi:hypothetical protein
MRRIRLCLAALIAMPGAGGATAGASAESAALDNPSAFEQAYGASFFDFDACGDGLSGRIYREVLVEKLVHCPFTDEAKARFRTRSAVQRRKSGEIIRALIERTGGMPVRLEGMTRTCREQMDSPEYQAVRSRLEAYSAGAASRDDVMPWPCDASEITP